MLRSRSLPRLPFPSIKPDRWLVAIALLAFALRLFGLTNEALWYDETFTALVSSLPDTGDFFTALLNDVHPPLWYLVERAFGLLFGFSAFSLRLPSLLFGVLSALELTGLVTQIADKNAGRAAGLLYALMPAQLYYGQEARTYTLLTLLTLLAIRGAINGNKRILIPALALSMLSHNLALVYCLPVGVMAYMKDKRAIRWIALAAAAYSPWLPGLWHQINLVNTSGFWIPAQGPGSALYYVFFTTWFTRLPPALAFHAGLSSMFFTAAGAVLAWSNRKQVYPLLVLSFAPPALLYLVSLVWEPMMLDRALLPAGAGVLGLWGFMISKVSRGDKAAIASVLLPLLVTGVVSFYKPADYQDTRPGARIDTRIPADWIRDRWQENDVIYHMIVESSVTYEWYMSDYPNYTLLGEARIDRNLTEPTMQAMDIKHAAFNDLYAMGYDRAWFIWYNTPIVPDRTIEESQVIIDSYPVLEEIIFYDREYIEYTVYLLDLTVTNHD